MKKYLSMILVLVMVFALAVPAFAAGDVDTVEGNASQEVTAGYTKPSDTAAAVVYRVTLTWEPTATEKALSYTGKQSTYTWDTTGLVYKENVDTAEGWEGSTGYKLTVTNYSNAAVTAATSADVKYNLSLSKPGSESETLKSAADGIEYTDTTTQGKVSTAEFTYTYSAADGATAPAIADVTTVTVGTITVTVAAAN